ncbi:kinase-like protein, partial [Fistulina hepatica ATCC 64428]
GQIFNAVSLISGREVAVKFEEFDPLDRRIASVPYEAAVYHHLGDHHALPRVHWSGTMDGMHILIIDKLGPNLQQLRRACRGTFSLTTIKLLAEVMLDVVEHAHKRSIIFRDIKPENFAVGYHPYGATSIYAFDFGLARLYINPSTGKHIPYREDRHRCGTIRYCSHNAEYGREQSRRDDIEALGHTLLYLFLGSLPWQGIYAPGIDEKKERIREMKTNNSFREFLNNTEGPFLKYFEHCWGLEFEQEPDYDYLRSLFRRTSTDGPGVFDWISGAHQGTLLPCEYRFDLPSVFKGGQKLPPSWRLTKRHLADALAEKVALAKEIEMPSS